ncbi:MAG TPA: DinB family protein [Cyclobacteriaceae bacterium]|nr:DinB family protein [Cyclobacteriaceae bacterium]
MKKTLYIICFCIPVLGFSQGQFQQESAGAVNFASGRLVQLLDAVPDDKLNWSPGDGVRSFRDVFAHIAQANYFFGSRLGTPVPDGVDVMNLAASLKTKDQLKSALTESFKYLTEAMRNAKDESMSERVEFPFPGEYTTMSAMLIALTHVREHMGQLIAYTRVNGITPPWSE